eukprot:1899602-Rhodomonas_salina.1
MASEDESARWVTVILREYQRGWAVQCGVSLPRAPNVAVSCLGFVPGAGPLPGTRWAPAAKEIEKVFRKPNPPIFRF